MIAGYRVEDGKTEVSAISPGQAQWRRRYWWLVVTHHRGAVPMRGCLDAQAAVITTGKPALRTTVFMFEMKVRGGRQVGFAGSR